MNAFNTTYATLALLGIFGGSMFAPLAVVGLIGLFAFDSWIDSLKVRY